MPRGCRVWWGMFWSIVRVRFRLGTGCRIIMIGRIWDSIWKGQGDRIDGIRTDLRVVGILCIRSVLRMLG